MSEHVVLLQVIRQDSENISEVLEEYEIGRFPGTPDGEAHARAASELLLAECGYEDADGEPDADSEDGEN